MSAPILTLLKRTDELHVVEQAHANPRFVEDVVREMIAGVVEEFPELEDDAFVQAHQRNFETIHAHDVIAERTGLLGELRASSQAATAAHTARSTTGCGASERPARWGQTPTCTSGSVTRACTPGRPLSCGQSALRRSASATTELST